MEISNSTLPTTQERGTTVVKSASATSDSANATSYETASVQTGVTSQSDSVSLSGEALMLSRLYGSEQGVPTKPQVGLNKSNDGMNPVAWLTDQDRRALSDMYAYAQQQGADLRYVDTVAFQIAYYRQSGDVTANSNSNDAATYDAEGHRITYAFTDQDAASASAILNGQGINSTKLDKGFLSYVLDPGTGWNHVANFQFLEKFINQGSDTGSAQSVASQFSTFTVKQEHVELKSKDVTESRIANYTYDGSVSPPAYTLTEHGVKNGWVIGVDGYPVQKDEQAAVQGNDKQNVLAVKPPKSLGLMLLSLLQNIVSHKKNNRSI